MITKSLSHLFFTTTLSSFRLAADHGATIPSSPKKHKGRAPRDYAHQRPKPSPAIQIPPPRSCSISGNTHSTGASRPLKQRLAIDLHRLAFPACDDDHPALPPPAFVPTIEEFEDDDGDDDVRKVRRDQGKKRTGRLTNNRGEGGGFVGSTCAPQKGPLQYFPENVRVHGLRDFYL